MQKNWLTKESDLKIAINIIKKHLEQSDTEILGLFEISIYDRDNLDIHLSDWVLELAEYFYKLYGKEQGDFVTQMVLSKCLTDGHTIH